jgi:hypothetical protein
MPTIDMSVVPDGLAAQLASHAFDGVSLVDVSDLSEEQRHGLPRWWGEAASVQGPDAIAFAAQQWREAVPGVFTGALALFEERAVGVFVGREDSRPSKPVILIYVLRSQPGSMDPFVCWYGYKPTDHLDNRTNVFRPGVKADLTQVPEALRNFYTRLHNRFRMAGYGQRGLVGVDDLFTLDGEPDDYEYIDGDPVAPPPDTLLPLFVSSWGRICLELGTERAWHQNDVMLESVGDIEPALDSWIRKVCSPHGADE